MDKDQENLDPKNEPQVPSEDSSPEDIESSQDYDSSMESEQLIESSEEEPTDKTLAKKKKHFSLKGWLFSLFLLIILSAGGYFYIQMKGFDALTNLPWGFEKSFPTTTITPKSPTTELEAVTIEPAPEVLDKAKEPSSYKKIISNNQKTIDLLRNKIQSLEIELSLKNKTLEPQKVSSVTKHISGQTVVGKTKALIENETVAPEIAMQDPFIPPTRAEAEPVLKKNQPKKTSPQRSKEVQAYLDFIEGTGSKIALLVAEWSNRLLALIR